MYTTDNNNQQYSFVDSFLIILRRNIKSKVSPVACSNLNTVAIRFPKHKMIRAILKRINFPLAMPSANKSTKVSPVSSIDVYDEFKKIINFPFDNLIPLLKALYIPLLGNLIILILL